MGRSLGLFGCWQADALQSKSITITEYTGSEHFTTGICLSSVLVSPAWATAPKTKNTTKLFFIPSPPQISILAKPYWLTKYQAQAKNLVNPFQLTN
jgi:hypothetical protein